MSCGGGGGGSSESELNAESSTVSVKGVAIDGYLARAKVCFDLNDNDECDESEPTTYTGEKGEYLLEVPEAEVNKHKVVVKAIKEITEDDGQPVSDNFVLTSLKENYEVTSPLTTVASYFEEKKELPKDIAEEVLRRFAPDVLKNSSLTEDYIKTNKLQVAKLAEKIVELMIYLKNLGLTYDQSLTFVSLKLPKIAALSKNDEAFQNWLNSLDEDGVYGELEVAEVSKLVRLLSDATFYNFVIDWDEKTGINFFSVRKSVFSDLTEGSGEVTFLGYDIDDDATAYPDISVNSLSEIENWSEKYGYNIKVENDGLVFEGDLGSLKVLAVSKIDLSGLTLNYAYIFPDDTDSEVYGMGITDFSVKFNGGQAYLFTLVYDNKLKSMYLFDETAADQIVKALKDWYAPSKNLPGKTLYHFVLEQENAVGIRKDVFSTDGTYKVYRHTLGTDSQGDFDLNEVDWQPYYEFTFSAEDSGELELNGSNGNYKVVSVVKRNLKDKELPAGEVLNLEEGQNFKDLTFSFNSGQEWIIWVEDAETVIPRYYFDENGAIQILEQLLSR